jgi:ubiquinone/menaquinone biosynthesis C-methylase UbiE
LIDNSIGRANIAGRGGLDDRKNQGAGTMPDVWSTVKQLDDATQERLATVLEARGADAQQQELRRALLSDIDFPGEARVLDVGSGTGVLTRLLARWPKVGSVVGVDPAGSLVEKARELAAGLPNVDFREADGRALPLADESFDVVVFDSTLSHVPEPERAVAEAFRVLQPGGWLATLDGDYATTTVALGDDDPLQVCVDVMMANSVNDRWLMRRLSAMVRAKGFEQLRFRSHGFVDTSGGAYMLSVVDRGADMLRNLNSIGDDGAAALKSEARRRAEMGSFFGHIAYASLTARKPS